MRRVRSSVIWFALPLLLISNAHSELIDVTVQKSSISSDDALYYQVRPGTITAVQCWLPDGTSMTVPVFINAPPFRMEYKIKWLGYPTWQKKSGSNWTSYRDTNTLMGLREDGVVIYKSTK